MTKPLTFYTNPMSRGRIVRWMLEELNASYETKVLEYGASMQSPEFLAINPMGKVPAIQHGETVVTECAAICAYLAEAFPEAGLAPHESERGAYYRWMFFAAGPVEAAVTNHTLGVEVPADKRGLVGYANYETTVETLAKAVAAHPYIAGARFTAADVYVSSQVGWGMSFGTLPKRPEFEAYVERTHTREANRRANELDNALAK